jgi:hypothetical protein
MKKNLGVSVVWYAGRKSNIDIPWAKMSNRHLRMKNLRYIFLRNITALLLQLHHLINVGSENSDMI